MGEQYVGPAASGPNDIVTKAVLDAAIAGVPQAINAGMTFVRIGPNDPLPSPTGVPLIIFRDSA